MITHVVMPDPSQLPLDTHSIQYASNEMELREAIHRVSVRAGNFSVSVFQLVQISKVVKPATHQMYKVINGEVIPE